jgi:hypothetical protein
MPHMSALDQFKAYLSTLRHNQIITVGGQDYITYNKNGVMSWSGLSTVPHSIHEMAIKIEDQYILEVQNGR